MANVVGNCLLMINLMLLFYSLIVIIIPVFYTRQFALGASLSLMGYVIFLVMDYINFNYVLPYLGVPDYIGSFKSHAEKSYSVVIGTCGSAIVYFTSHLKVEQIRIQNERQRALMARELDFLKNQFNSHITFNFLSYCYSKVYRVSKETADAIELFSSMLRYSLTIKPGLKVPVEEEIEYIRNFIELQKLLSNNVYVNFHMEGDFKNKTILPSVLITFIENAFTHGESSQPLSPIDIRLYAHDASISLNVVNKKKMNRKIRSTKLGLDNVKQLLQLYYGNRYRLTIQNEQSDFTCKLDVSLN